MLYTVYIIYSKTKDRYYIGQTENVEKRLEEHIVRKNLGAEDWILVYTESYNTRRGAVKREAEIKSKKRRASIEALISSSG
jgi:putative endonuclease